MKKLTTFDWIICSLNSIVFHTKKDFSAPKVIKDYSLNFEIKKKYLSNYSVGIYKNGKNKYFIKSWSSTRMDYEYYSLINEFNVSSILYKNNTSNKTKKILNFVKPIELIFENNRVSAVYEFIEGKTLDKFSKSTQAKNLSIALENFPKLTKSLNKQDLKYFKKRSLFWFVISLPFRIKNINIPLLDKILIIYRSITYTLFSSKNNDLELAHRDLTPENLMINNKGDLYLLDLEQVCLTFKGYDQQNVLISPQNKETIKFLGDHSPALNTSISSLIAIHSMAGESIPEFIKYYSKFISIF